MRGVKRISLLWVGILALIMSFMVSIAVGASSYSFWQMVQTIWSGNKGAAYTILLHVRSPRAIAALLAGAALAVGGGVIQSVLSNPLAGPSIIGVNAGAGFCAVLAMVLFPSFPSMVPLLAFGGAFLATLLVYGLARKAGASKMTLVLAGVAINSLLGAASDTLYTIFPDAIQGATAFKIGGLAGVRLTSLILPAILIVLAIAVIYLLRRGMDVLALGEETARNLGLPIEAVRFSLLLLASMLCGSAVSFGGLLGFIGLIVPHGVRMVVGSEAKALIPGCAIGGGVFMLLCDTVARLIFVPYELPVGVVMSFLGAPFFLYLLLKGGRSDVTM